MKFRYLHSIIIGCALAFAALASSSCGESELLSEANKGKDKPVVAASLMNSQIHEFTYAILPSTDTRYFGFAVREASNDAAPSAYELTTGTVSGNYLGTRIFTSTEESSPRITTHCTHSERYQVFSAGMSADGLLSEVDTLEIYIPGASPSAEIKEGVYRVNTQKFNNVENPNAGQPFELMISRWSGNRSKYVIYANWFNIAEQGYALPPYLLGEVDYENLEVVFDGTIVNSVGEQLGTSAFSTVFSDYGGYALAFWGGGSGYDPIRIRFSERGYLLTISACQYRLHRPIEEGGAQVGIFDGLNGGEMLDFVRDLPN